jgi:hypothetical protein
MLKAPASESESAVAAVAAGLVGAAATQCEGPAQNLMLAQRMALQAALQVKLTGTPKPGVLFVLEEATDTRDALCDPLRPPQITCGGKALQAAIEGALDTDGKQGASGQLRVVDSIILPHLQGRQMLSPEETRQVLFPETVIAVLVCIPSRGPGSQRPGSPGLVRA